MIDFIKSLNLDDTQKNALIGAFNQEKAKFEKTLNDAQLDFVKKEKTFKEEIGKFKDYEELKVKNQDLEREKNDNLKMLTELKNRNTSDKIDFEIEKRLLKENAKHPDLLMKALDKSEIKFDENNNLVGLDESLGKVKEAYGDLFETSNLKGAEPMQRTKSPETINVDNMSPQDVMNNWEKIMQQRRK